MPATITKPRAAQRRDSANTILLIGLFKLLKGVLLVLVAIGALRLVHKDVSAVLMHWIDILRVDPDNRFIHRLIIRSFGVSARQLRELSAGTFFYASILLTEGIGLLMRRRWAEYFTVISTGVFIPLEVYEIFHHFRWVKVGVLAINVAIVWYLINRIRNR